MTTVLNVLPWTVAFQLALLVSFLSPSLLVTHRRRTHFQNKTRPGCDCRGGSEQVTGPAQVQEEETDFVGGARCTHSEGRGSSGHSSDTTSCIPHGSAPDKCHVFMIMKERGRADTGKHPAASAKKVLSLGLSHCP